MAACYKQGGAMKILQINEIRKAYFLKAFGREPEDMLIISMGACNYNCPYCKRDGQFKGMVTLSSTLTMLQWMRFLA